jgi:hypothetical protein
MHPAPLRPTHAVALAGLLLVTVATLHLMGQPWRCDLGDLSIWSGGAASPHTSQHFADPYTFTHLLHGLILYAAIWALLRGRLDAGGRFVLAMALEVAWELFENTDFVIERYRDATISLNYYGDSIVNVLGDLVACALGYGAAMLLPLWGSAAVFLAIEAVLALWIRDNLLLNIVMLIYPSEAIRAWQMGGG